jgi:hypothetical protein
MCVKSGWEELVKEGEALFDYMITNFDSMFDDKSRIKHFDIENGDYGLTCYVDEIKEKHFDSIQTALICWIKHELDINELFKNNNWKPFRDQEMLTTMFLGYRKMFEYKQYYFQLAIDDWCGDCSYCKENENTAIHFELELYGWLDKDTNILQPYYHDIVLSDKIMAEKYWNIK